MVTCLFPTAKEGQSRPTRHQGWLAGGPSPGGRAPTPALGLSRQPVLTHLSFVPSLSQLLSYQCLAFAGSRRAKTGRYLAGLHLRAPVLPQSSHLELLPLMSRPQRPRDQ